MTDPHSHPNTDAPLPRPPPSTAGGGKLRLAVAGLGRLGEQHAINAAEAIRGAELVAICDADANRLRLIGDRFGVKHRTDDFDALVAIKEVDAVIIVSPSPFHTRHIEKALAAGKHVFSEKPLGVTVKECLEAEKAVAAHPELTFMIGFMRRFDTSYAAARAMVKNGDIGRPILFRGTSQDPDKYIHEAIDFAPRSGGIFLDMAVHDIDLARWFLESEPEEVWAIGDCYAYREFAASNDVDNAGCMMKFRSGAIAFLFAGRTAPHGYNVEAEIVGTKGILRIATVPQKNMVEILDSHGVRKECSQRFLERFFDAYRTEVQEFVNCVREGRKPAITVQDGVRASQIAYKCKESFETGKLVKTGL